MHILIMEDEAAIRQELKQLLENSLYQVTAFERFVATGSRRYDVVSEIMQIGRAHV